MQSKLFQVMLLIIALTGTVPSALGAAENPGVGGQGSSAVERGTWKLAKSAAAKTGQ